MIDGIGMKNWKTHLDSKIAFTSGTNVIIGNVGTGKSSVLDAVCFALFGTFPVLQSKKIKLDDVLMRRPVEKTRAEVELAFTAYGKKYSVKRVVEKGKGTSYSEVREGGKLLETNTSRVTEVVEKVLKTNYETFSKAIYSEQNNMDYFLTLGKGQRTKKIDELLLMDKFESVRSACVSARNRIADRKSATQSVIDQARAEDLEKKISELHASVERLKAEELSISKSLGEAARERSVLEQEIKGVSSLAERIEALKKSKAVLGELLETASSTVKKLELELQGRSHADPEHAIKIKDRIDSLGLRMKDLSSRREKVLGSLAEDRSRVVSLKEGVSEMSASVEEKLSAKGELDSLGKEFGDVEKEIEVNGELLNKAIYEAESIRGRMKEFELAIKQLSQADSKCPVCDSRLYGDMKDALVKTKQGELEALSLQLPRLESERKSLESRTKQLQATLKRMGSLGVGVADLDRLQAQLLEKRALLKTAEENVGKGAKAFEESKSALDSLAKELESANHDKDEMAELDIKFRALAENRERESDIRKRLDGAAAELAAEESRLGGRNLDALKMRLNGMVLKEAMFNKDLAANKRMLEEKTLRLSELVEKSEELKGMREKTLRLEKIIADLTIFDKAVEATQDELRKQFVEAVNYTMNQLWGTLYPYGDFTEIRMHVEDGDYVLKLLSKSGVWGNADGGVSGGERSIACLALRIAFALVLAPNIRTLLLDEPGHNMDNNTISQLATVLRERMGEFMEQVILITHQQELEEAVTGLAYRLERDKNNDDFTRIVQLQ